MSALRDALVHLYGNESVTLDRRSFISGINWLPQILSSVAMSEIVICAIGPSWEVGAIRANHEVDYLVEELQLARKLGKPIVPVCINSNVNLVLSSLPDQIRWLSDIHFFQFEPAAGTSKENLASAISAYGGSRLLAATNSKSTLHRRFSNDILRAVHDAAESIFRPTSRAASALLPARGNTQRSVYFASCVVVLLCLDTVLISGEISLFSLASFIGNIAITAVLFFGVFSTLSKLGNSRPSAASIVNYAIHCASTIFLLLAIWAMAFWLVLPDAAQLRFVAMRRTDAPFGQVLEKLFDDLTITSIVLTAIVQWGGLLHLIFVAWGVAKAGVVALGWKRWSVFVPMLLIALTSVAAALVLATSAVGLRRANLPMPVNLTWLPDSIDSGGVKKSPFRFAVSGVIEKRSSTINFQIKKFEAENRGQPPIRIDSLMCALGLLRAGKFEWPGVMHVGKVQVQQELESDRSLFRRDLSLEIPLTSELVSGATVFNCYVEHPGGSYPIGNGSHVTLRWE